MNRCLFLFFLFFSFKAQAQCILSGHVTDEKDNGLGGVSVSVLNEDSTFVHGVLTDEKGDFTAVNLHKGTYILHVRYMGYESGYINTSITAEKSMLPAIRLKSSNILLGEVLVSSNSVMRKKGYLLIIPDKTQKKHAYTGYDMVYNLMIPGLKVDRRNGKATTMAGEVSMYINGVKANQRDIENLRSKDILKVEYHEIPTGRYAGEPAVINYITKVYDTGGYVSFIGEQNIGYNGGKYDVSSKTTRKNTSLTVYGGYNYQKHNGIAEDIRERLNLSEDIINRDRKSKDGSYSNNQQYGQIKVSNDTKKHNVYGILTLAREETPRNYLNSLLEYTGGKNEKTASNDGTKAENLEPSLKLNGTFHVADNQELSVLLEGAYAKNCYERNYLENNYLSMTKANEDFYSFSLRSFYNIEMKYNNSMYFSWMHFHNVTSSDYTGDYTSWQHLWRGETLLNAQYTQKIKEKVTYMISPGISVLNYRLHGSKLKRFWSPRLNSWILYNFSRGQQAGIGFGIGNNNPSISYLNSVDQAIDSYQIKRGNPYLGNTKVYDAFAKYQGIFKSLIVDLNLWYTTLSSNIIPDYYLENGKVISSFRSNSTFHKLKADLSCTYKFSDRLRANMNLKYERMSLARTPDMTANNYSGSFDVNYFIGLFTINAYVKTADQRLDESSLILLKSPASYGCSVRMNSNKWMIEAGVNNPFTKHVGYRQRADFGVYTFNETRTSRLYQQTGYVKVAYTFDFGRKTDRENGHVEKTVNSGILKVK